MTSFSEIPKSISEVSKQSIDIPKFAKYVNPNDIKDFPSLSYIQHLPLRKVFPPLIECHISLLILLYIIILSSPSVSVSYVA